MGEIEPAAKGTDAEPQWTTFVTLDAPDNPEHGLPLNPFTSDNVFDSFDAAVERAVAIRNDPHDALDHPLDPDESVTVKVTSVP